VKRLLIILLMLLVSSCCTPEHNGRDAAQTRGQETTIGSQLPRGYVANNAINPEIVYTERAPGIDIKVSKIKVSRGTLYITTIIPRTSSQGNFVAQTFVPD
jgi:hypothetical protein